MVDEAWDGVEVGAAQLGEPGTARDVADLPDTAHGTRDASAALSSVNEEARMARKIGGGAAYAVAALVVAIAVLLFASHEFFPAFNPAGGTSATK